MTQDPIASVVAFHQQLWRLSASGLPIDLGAAANGSPSSPKAIREAINRVEAALRLRVELGQPLGEAIEAAPELTLQHRTSLLAWLETEDACSAFGSLTQPAQHRLHTNRKVGVSMIQPLVLVTLTFFAFVVLSVFTTPKLEAIYLQLSKRPPGALNGLIALRDSMPIWGVLISAILIVAWFLHSKSTISGSRWQLGGSRYLESIRQARFADQVAEFMDRGMQRDHAMSLADAGLASEIKTASATIPPLLRWATSGDLGSEPVPVVFRFVASCYREIAEQQATGWRIVVPRLLLILFGGLLVLIFGLSLFVPIVDLLFEFSSPGGV